MLLRELKELSESVIEGDGQVLSLQEEVPLSREPDSKVVLDGDGRLLKLLKGLRELIDDSLALEILVLLL